ncbi:vacuolar ATPase assembly integral membrane protein VMA21 homolog isoform X1 [Corticium candelabrum]|uniref:vacuolar ATPase assembly integral membrane protein VMA21 homolog isoform X1 n=1 Tax=Corticium candelabrum TaxID=121492 RepID=UPI002E260743|nr:vacuolar ATPase assembly integral membrane protein VMA21 homolog isoform X1 [Corticium candelabrum]
MADTVARPSRQSWTSAEKHTLRVLLSFTLMMIVLPIAAFFFSQTVIFEGLQPYFPQYCLLGLGTASSGVASAVVAVLVVHGIIASYVWVAYKDEQPPIKED